MFRDTRPEAWSPEAENTRILCTLENVHMQLLRARSTDMSAAELGGKLRDSLRELGMQIEAVAEVLEWAGAPVAIVAGPGPSSIPARRHGCGGPEASEGPATSATPLDAERAERQAAARRAARARDAQGH